MSLSLIDHSFSTADTEREADIALVVDFFDRDYEETCGEMELDVRLYVCLVTGTRSFEVLRYTYDGERHEATPGEPLAEGQLPRAFLDLLVRSHLTDRHWSDYLEDLPGFADLPPPPVRLSPLFLFGTARKHTADGPSG
ncbi:MAG: hypothetical protein ACR2PG_06365 [Hyphomicrobiaceae bacterium]